MIGRLKQALLRALPLGQRLRFRYWVNRALGRLDDEMFHVDGLLSRRGLFLDVGANAGVYSFHFGRTMDRVVAFEPLEAVVEELAAARLPNVRIERCALSDAAGTATIVVPVRDGVTVSALASLQGSQDGGVALEVPVRRIDDFSFEGVVLVKIDVEGHEKEVLLGAEATIRGSRPVLLIEIEQRHHEGPIDRLFRYIEELGYEGFFLDHGRLVGLSEFDPVAHQQDHVERASSSDYKNNFIFVPR